MSMRDKIAKAILGFHSSPHDIKGGFDWRKAARTGEGNATYGEGTYIAESPKVSGQGGAYWTQFNQHFKGPEYRAAADYLQPSGFDRSIAAEKAAKDVEFARKAYGSDNPATREYEAVLKMLQSDKPVGARTYEVAIHARPEEFLDWYKPMREQPRILNSVLEQYPARDVMNKAAVDLDAIAARSVAEPDNAPLRDEFMAMYKAPNARMGSFLNDMEARSTWGDPGAKATGQKFYHRLGPSGDQAEATETLVRAGVPGIRYTDAGSRIGNPDVKTYNYVVGDDTNKLEILKKYGVMGAPAGAIGSLYDQNQYAEPQQ